MAWLLSGDVAIQYQVSRDLLSIKGSQLQHLQKKIAKQGWGAQFLRDKKQTVIGELHFTNRNGQVPITPFWISRQLVYHKTTNNHKKARRWFCNNLPGTMEELTWQYP